MVDEGLDAANLRLSLRVNGELRQDGNTSEMIYTFTDVIEHISPFLTMRSGDMIASGTPSGTAFEQGVDGPYLRAGDHVEVEVEGVGVDCETRSSLHPGALGTVELREPSDLPTALAGSLRGHGVIVTGGVSGIGRAMAIGFARSGAGVVAADIGEPADDLGEVGTRWSDRVPPAEVTDAEALRSCVDACEREFGAVDVLVNNAGITRGGPLHELADDRGISCSTSTSEPCISVARPCCRT